MLNADVHDKTNPEQGVPTILRKIVAKKREYVETLKQAFAQVQAQAEAAGKAAAQAGGPDAGHAAETAYLRQGHQLHPTCLPISLDFSQLPVAERQFYTALGAPTAQQQVNQKVHKYLTLLGRNFTAESSNGQANQIANQIANQPQACAAASAAKTQMAAKTAPVFVFECKKASPSKGLIRPDFNVGKLAAVYTNYASAISVLTDYDYFQGEYKFLREAKDNSSVPVLCKDFIIDSIQLDLARAHGADAVLLMLSVLDDFQYSLLKDYAESLGMGVLTEVVNHQEADRALALGAPVIGINNRNLHDLTIDRNRTQKLARYIVDKLKANPEVSPYYAVAQHAPVIISESGFATTEQLEEVTQQLHHLNTKPGFLVGSSLMAQADLDAACRNFLGNFVKAKAAQDKLNQTATPTKPASFLKVCGMTKPEQVLQAQAAGFTYFGAILVEKSPRYVSPEALTNLLANLAAEQTRALATQAGQTITPVLVFRNAPLEQVTDLLTKHKLTHVQLHGAETPAYVSQLRTAYAAESSTPLTVFKSLSVTVGQELSLADLTSQVEAVLEFADYCLLDAKVGNQEGGTGVSFDWSLVAQLPKYLKQRLILAGGLNLDNAQQAFALGLAGYDFNSGLELAPGDKDVTSFSKVANALASLSQGPLPN